MARDATHANLALIRLHSGDHALETLMRILMSFAVAVLIIVLPACQSTPSRVPALDEINNTLDAFHTAASEAPHPLNNLLGSYS